MSNRIETASEFVITRSDGSETRFEYYSDALAKLSAEGCVICGHTGDLEDGGDRTLIWKTPEEDFQGLPAYAVITARYDLLGAE